MEIYNDTPTLEKFHRLLEIHTYLVESLGEEQAIEKGLEHLADASGADRIYLYAYTEDEDWVKTVAEFQRSGLIQYIFEQNNKDIGYEPLPRRWRDKFESGGIIKGEAEQFPQSERGHLLAEGTVSLLCLPIRLKGRGWGYMRCEYCRNAYEWDEPLISALGSVASVFAASIVQHRRLQSYYQMKKIIAPSRSQERVDGSLCTKYADEDERCISVLDEINNMIGKYRSHLDQKTIFELLYQKSSDAVLIMHNGLFVDSNESALNMLGVSSMNEVLCILNHHPSSLSPEFQPDGNRSYEKSEELLSRCIKEGTCRFEWLFKRLDGSDLWVDTVLTRIAEGEDEIIHVAWRDISTRKEYEADLMQQKRELVTFNNDLGNKTTQLHMLYKRLEYSQKYQKAIFDGQPNIIVANFNIKTLCDGNRAFLDFVGYKDVPSFLAEHESICDYFIEKEGYISPIMEGKEWIEYVKENPEYSHYALMKRGDKECVFSVSVSEVYIENDKINIASFSDITELEEYKKTLELRIKAEVLENRNKDRMLHNQSKSVQMGEMLNMIAHQWRQPLNAISASAISVAMKLELDELEPDDVREHLTYIQWRVQKMSQTINDFMNFFKPDQEVQQFRLNDVMKDIESLMKAQLQGRGIRILYDTSNPIVISSYKKELAHVLINIIANARDAYEGLHMEVKTITISLTQLEDKTLSISVRDCAGGINPENLDKIFNPYFTTKDQGKGTGIGLYMSKRIVSEILHGSIEASNTGEGAEFFISFKNQ